MTGLGILIAAIVFLVIARYRCKKQNIVYRRLFYWAPIAIILTYFIGSYVDFILQVGIIPNSSQERLGLLTPYGYKFHFVGIAIGSTIAIRYLLKNIARLENKKLYIDVIFFALCGSLIPLGFFLLLGDDFIGRTTSGALGVQSLHTESELNKFGAVYPIGLFITICSLLTYVGMLLYRHKTQKAGTGLVGFVIILLYLSIIFLFQQYPRYGVINVAGFIFDIKQYVALVIILICLYTYHQRQQEEPHI